MGTGTLAPPPTPTPLPYGTIGGPPETTAGPPRRARERLMSLDVFRGLTVAGMLLVNDPGSWATIYPPLRHAEWHGWTPTDLIFPFFLFIVGITTRLSLTARRERGDTDAMLVRQVVRRGLLIFLFGLLVNGFPFFTWTDIAGIPQPTFLDRVVDRLEHWRVMGVLQRIGLAYMLGALLTLRTTLRQQIVLLAVLLFGYWFATTLLPVPGTGAMGAHVLGSPSGTLSAWFDRLLLDWGPLGNHNWASSRTWDPEGPFSTLPAVGTVMLGVLAGRWIGALRPLPERLNGLFAVGALGMVVGLMWNWSFPINKSLWTSSYVVFCAGMAAVALATVMWIIEERGVRWWTQPFLVYGMNPIVAFIASGMLARLIYSIFKVTYDGKTVPLQSAIYQALFASWLPPHDASLAFALSYVLLFYGILYVLHRRNIFLKV